MTTPTEQAKHTAKRKRIGKNELWRCPVCHGEYTGEDNLNQCQNIRDYTHEQDTAASAQRELVVQNEELVKVCKSARTMFEDLSRHYVGEGSRGIDSCIAVLNEVIDSNAALLSKIGGVK